MVEVVAFVDLLLLGCCGPCADCFDRIWIRWIHVVIVVLSDRDVAEDVRDMGNPSLAQDIAECVV